MLAYRPAFVRADSRPLTPALVEEIAADVFHPRNFLVGPETHVTWRTVAEEPFWELFCGRALDGTQTRERRAFQSWWLAVENGDPDEPLIALRWDRADGMLFVTRSIQCRVHEGYDAGGGVFETREAIKWVRELVGSVRHADIGSAGRLRDELAGVLLQAVVGTSRLPLTSVESPLPQFTLGQLAYGYEHPGDEPASWSERIADPTLSPFESAKRLEAALRFSAPDQLPGLAKTLTEIDADRGRWFSLLVGVFNSVSLTPYTDFVGRSFAFADSLGRGHPDLNADCLARLTLLIDRHLGAYDLVKFHHRGANYPDALVLAELWPRLLQLASPRQMQSKRFRRAIRHALLLRLEYEGLRVPDRPTSIGDNARVLPAPHLPLDEQQIHAPNRRPRRLFDDPLPDNQNLWDVLRDLDDPAELQQLGFALFLHRPFGFAKNPTEPDQTPLVSHRLMSRMVAERRLRALARHADRIGGKPVVERWLGELARLQVDGVPLQAFGGTPKPGVVSLHDAAQTADDWLALATTTSSLKSIADAFDWPEPLSYRLLLPDPESATNLTAYDSTLTPVAKLVVDDSAGFIHRGGIELPRAGLKFQRLAGDGSSQKPGVVLPAIGEGS